MKRIIMIAAVVVLLALGAVAAHARCYGCLKLTEWLRDTECTSVDENGHLLTFGGRSCWEQDIKDEDGGHLYYRCMLYGCCYVVAN